MGTIFTCHEVKWYQEQRGMDPWGAGADPLGLHGSNQSFSPSTDDPDHNAYSDLDSDEEHLRNSTKTLPRMRKDTRGDMSSSWMKNVRRWGNFMGRCGTNVTLSFKPGRCFPSWWVKAMVQLLSYSDFLFLCLWFFVYHYDYSDNSSFSIHWEASYQRHAFDHPEINGQSDEGDKSTSQVMKTNGMGKEKRISQSSINESMGNIQPSGEYVKFEMSLPPSPQSEVWWEVRSDSHSLPQTNPSLGCYVTVTVMWHIYKKMKIMASVKLYRITLNRGELIYRKYWKKREKKVWVNESSEVWVVSDWSVNEGVNVKWDWTFGWFRVKEWVWM